MNNSNSFRFILILSLVLIIVLILFTVIIFNTFDKWETRAFFGDMFGSINALFSGLALAGIIYTIIIQRKELALQRKELELNREELRRSAKAQEQSVKSIESSSKLEALNHLINGYNLKIDGSSSHSYTEEITKKRDEYLAELELLYKSMIENSNS